MKVYIIRDILSSRVEVYRKLSDLAKAFDLNTQTLRNRLSQSGNDVAIIGNYLIQKTVLR